MKKNNSNKVKLGASDKIVRGFGYIWICSDHNLCTGMYISIPVDSWKFIYGRRSDPYGRCTVDSETVYTGSL